MNPIYLAVLVLSHLTFVLTYKDSFTEELLLKPLYSEQVYAHFQFSNKWDIDLETETFNHSRLFPRSLGEIIERFNVQELHVSLTGGLWRYENWGYPVTDAAPGAEVWAWFHPSTKDVNKNWKLLANSLSGLLCASLNFIDTSNSISPEYSFRPRGVTDSPSVNNTFLRYASLPREIVCTENLTPWKKLLPCDSKSGLASLLNSGYIHNTRYHSIGLHLRRVCRDESCQALSLDLQQTVSLVYDYGILGTKDWSLSKLFGQGVNGNCVLAERSEVYVDMTSAEAQSFELEPQPQEVMKSTRGGYESTFGMMTLTEIQQIFLYKFKLNQSAAETAQKINQAFGNNSGIRRWFAKNRFRDFSFENESRSGRPTVVRDDVLRTLKRCVKWRNIFGIFLVHIK